MEVGLCPAAVFDKSRAGHSPAATLGNTGLENLPLATNQLFATKSIDKLISDSEQPERSLKKTLGPVSLTALGIGAVIGSGIFTVVGTAIAGQKFDTSSILNAPLLDYLIKHTSSLGRPGAGPAIALSLILVAVVCAFTALCYEIGRAHV